MEQPELDACLVRVEGAFQSLFSATRLDLLNAFSHRVVINATSLPTKMYVFHAPSDEIPCPVLTRTELRYPPPPLCG